MCCKSLAENTGRKKSPKIAIWAPSHNFVGLHLYNWGTYRQSEKDLLNSYISSTCPHNMVNVGPLTADIGLPVWGTPANWTGFAYWLRYCSDVAHRRPAKLCVMFGRLLGCYIIYTFSGILPPNGILPGAKFTLRPSLAFSYIGSVTARHSSSGRQPNFVTLSRGRHLYLAARPSRWASAHILVMAALRSKCGHYIFVLWFLSFFFIPP